jgi:hypothetical protein
MIAGDLEIRKAGIQESKTLAIPAFLVSLFFFMKPTGPPSAFNGLVVNDLIQGGLTIDVIRPFAKGGVPEHLAEPRKSKSKVL